MTSALILKAILFVAPWLPPATAADYAKFIKVASVRRNIHPLLFVAFATVESTWTPTAKSTTADFGLMQVHVAKKGSARFLGRERELLNPRTNINEWGRLAQMWMKYHDRSCGMLVRICDTENCTNERIQYHEWFEHLKWGYVIKNREYGMLISALFELLINRFDPKRAGES